MKMAPNNIRINPLGGAICIVVALVLFFYIFGVPEFLMSSGDRISMKELLSASIVLAQRGGDRVRVIRRSDTLQQKVKGETAEGAKEFVSKGDMESHHEIFYGFTKAFPGLNIVSEEHEKQPINFAQISDVNKHLAEVEAVVKSDESISRKAITVWIDPLDATQEYTEMNDKDGTDMLHYVTTMVCVAVGGVPVIGVIHKPFENNDQGETTWAWQGHGHSDNVKEVTTTRDSNEPHRIIVSRSHAGPVKDFIDAALDKSLITNAGGAGYKTLEVVKAKQDAYLHKTLIKKWDICAGHALLSAVGGKMTTLDGQSIDYSSGDVYKNEGGLLATVNDHDYYLAKFAAAGKSKS